MPVACSSSVRRLERLANEAGNPPAGIALELLVELEAPFPINVSAVKDVPSAPISAGSSAGTAGKVSDLWALRC